MIRSSNQFETEVRELRAKLRQLRRENRGLRRENSRLRERVAALEERIADLLAKLEEAQRQGKRQAAPFSKGKLQSQPKKRGRKPGSSYGKKAHRPPPAPDQIDEFYKAPLPDACPYCGGTIQQRQIVPQFQTEIPRRPIYRQFNVHVGSCQQCGRRLQGTHPRQTSDALGAAASQLGPDALAAMAYLKKYGGLSAGKIAQLLEVLFGISITRGGVSQAVQRAGQRCRPVYVQQIQAAVRRSPWVVADETGWKVGGRSAWLHVLVGTDATCYCISRRRSSEVAAAVLGWNYAGMLIHDGLATYNRLAAARHQQCVGHVLARCKRMLATAVGGAVRFPRQVIALLEEALRLRDEHRAGRLTEDELADATLSLACGLEVMTDRPKQNAENERLSKHLRRHLWEWFRFLLEPATDATNYRAEQALRLGVINRKVWGGNRDETGRMSQQVLTSVIATCFRRGVCPIDFISRCCRTWSPRLIPP